MASPKWSLVTLSQCQPGQIAAADDDNDNVAGTGLLSWSSWLGIIMLK